MPVENEVSLEEGLKLLYGNNKAGKRVGSSLSEAERKAGEYLTITRSCQNEPKIGGSCLLYEPFKVIMGSVTYKPDWVVSRGPFDRQCFEVKAVRTGPRGGMKWAGFRSREAGVKLELLRRVSEEFGWRVYWLLVEGNQITEKEII